MKLRFFIFLIVASVSFTSCKKTKLSTDVSSEKDYEGPLLVFQNVETMYSQSASVRLKMEAPRQMRMQNMDEVFPDGVLITIYDDIGTPKTTIKADSAVYLDKVKTYTMVGNVLVRNEIQNQQLETQTLNWDERLREIYTNDKVKITTAKELIYGIGMRAKQDFSQYKIAKPTGTFSVEKENQ